MKVRIGREKRKKFFSIPSRKRNPDPSLLASKERRVTQGGKESLLFFGGKG
jgi:hypothetical protein